MFTLHLRVLGTGSCPQRAPHSNGKSALPSAMPLRTQTFTFPLPFWSACLWTQLSNISARTDSRNGWLQMPNIRGLASERRKAWETYGCKIREGVGARACLAQDRKCRVRRASRRPSEHRKSSGLVSGAQVGFFCDLQSLFFTEPSYYLLKRGGWTIGHIPKETLHEHFILKLSSTSAFEFH